MWKEADRLNDFDLVFGGLKELWKPYEDGLDIIKSEGSFSVEWRGNIRRRPKTLLAPCA